MKWIKNIGLLSELPEAAPKCSTPCHSIASKHQNGLLDTKDMSLLKHADIHCRGGVALFCKSLISQPRNTSWRFKQPYSSAIWSEQHAMTFSRQYGKTTHNGPDLSRDFLVKLWLADRKMKPRPKGLRKRGILVEDSDYETDLEIRSPRQLWRYLSTLFTNGQVKPSQPLTGLLKPGSPEEVRVAPLLARSNLLITRDIEWANLMLGFEQENKYGIVDACYPQSPVGYIREQSNLIARQLLRSRRPFVAHITDGLGNELFRVRRPFWWINSSIYAEIDGKEVGVVHRRWHLWRRIYDLYLGNNQFAVVENPGFWNWTFTLKNIDGEVLAQIDRDWRGFGFEILTDAGQYVIRFGSSDLDSNTGPTGVIEELDVARPLTLSERAVAVALAVSLDNDYFSRHGGWGIPFIAVGE